MNGFSFIAAIASFLDDIKSPSFSILLLLFYIRLFYEENLYEIWAFICSRSSFCYKVFSIIPAFAFSTYIFFSGFFIYLIWLNLTSGVSSTFFSSIFFFFWSNIFKTFFLFATWESRNEEMCEIGCLQEFTFFSRALSANYFILPIIFILLGISFASENFSLYGSMGTIPIKTWAFSRLRLDYLKI